MDPILQSSHPHLAAHSGDTPSARAPRIATKALLACTTLLLTACVPGVDDLLDNLTGKDVELRKLREQRSVLESTLRFDLESSPVVLSGSNAGVCLVLAHEVQFGDTTRLAQEYLRGTELQGELVTEAGQRIPLKGLQPIWQSRGVLGQRQELAVCMRPCAVLPPAGSRIRQIAIATTKPIQTLGIYWHAVPTLKERQQRKAASPNDEVPLVPDFIANGCLPPA